MNPTEIHRSDGSRQCSKTLDTAKETTPKILSCMREYTLLRVISLFRISLLDLSCQFVITRLVDVLLEGILLLLRLDKENANRVSSSMLRIFYL